MTNFKNAIAQRLWQGYTVHSVVGPGVSSQITMSEDIALNAS